MNKDLLVLLKKVVLLLENGVKPSDLSHVLSNMGEAYNNGLNFEFKHIFERLSRYYDKDFKESNFKTSMYDIDKVKS